MGQLATDLRLQISQSTVLQTSVGVCDAFNVMPSQNALLLKEHLTMFTQDNKPMLGNPAHPRLFFDECTQLLVPFIIGDHESIAVIKLSIGAKSRQAAIEFFDPTGCDLNSDHLAVLVAFFTENRYSVDYQCVSELLLIKDLTKLTCYKALDMVNFNAGIPSNLVKTLLDKPAEKPPIIPAVITPAVMANPVEAAKPLEPVKPIEAVKPVEPTNPQATLAPASLIDLRWIVGMLATIAVPAALYLKYEYLKEIVFMLANLLPADPLLAFAACGGVFFSAWLIVAGIGYLLSQNESTVLDKKLVTSCIANFEESVRPKPILNAFLNLENKATFLDVVVNRDPLMPIKRRSLS